MRLSRERNLRTCCSFNSSSDPLGNMRRQLAPRLRLRQPCRPNDANGRCAHRAQTRPVYIPASADALDDELSNRPISLDAAGYFIIAVDAAAHELVAEYFTNSINDDGLACDPDTGEVIPCTTGYMRHATQTFRGKSAKDVSVQILEHGKSDVSYCTHMEHANYLGRELQKAEFALVSGVQYVQD